MSPSLHWSLLSNSHRSPGEREASQLPLLQPLVAHVVHGHSAAGTAIRQRPHVDHPASQPPHGLSVGAAVSPNCVGAAEAGVGAALGDTVGDTVGNAVGAALGMPSA